MYLSEKMNEQIFFWIFIFIYSAYFLTFLGIININIRFISLIRNIISAFACLLLIIRFNPFVIHVLTSFDKMMIFTVSGFLLFNIIISELVKYDSKDIFIGYFGKNIIL